MGAYKKDGERFDLFCSSGTRGSSLKLEVVRFRLDIKGFFYSEGDGTLG